MSCFALSFGGREHAIGPRDGHVPLLATTGDAHSHPANVLQQSQPQHDREGPQLPQVQRFDGLVGSEEGRGIVAVDPTVLMGDQLQRDVVDPRKAGQGPAGQSRQLPAVPAGQMPPSQSDLLLDEIEVVEQPGLCRQDPLSRRRGGGDRVVGGHQNALVLRQPGEQPVSARTTIDKVTACQRGGVVFQLIGAEEFGAQQLRVGVAGQPVWLLCHGSWPTEDDGIPFSFSLRIPLDGSRHARRL